MLALVLAFLVGAYVENKFATKIELVVGKLVGLVHLVIGTLVGVWNAFKAIFTKKPEAAPVEAAPVAQPTDTPPQA